MKDRETRAIDSEFKRTLQKDNYRLFQVWKHLSSRDNPYFQCGFGNWESLKENPSKEGIDVRAELIAFYQKYYSANIMKIVILGMDSLDQLSDWAVEKFSPIRNLGITPPSYSISPWTSKELLVSSRIYFLS